MTSSSACVTEEIVIVESLDPILHVYLFIIMDFILCVHVFSILFFINVVVWHVCQFYYCMGFYISYLVLLCCLQLDWTKDQAD